MAKGRISKVLKGRTRYYDNYAVVYVQLEDGIEEYAVYVGGEVVAYHDKNQNKAVVIPPWQREGQSRSIALDK